MSRDHIPLKVKLAAALLKLGDIPYSDARQMSADQICALYNFDHDPIRVADGGVSEPWNLTPRLIKEHRTKTAKIDVPQIAKSRRLRDNLAAFNERIAAKSAGRELPKSPKLQSRGFNKELTRTFGGKVKPRKVRAR